jgi:hypothetical protein
MAGETFNLIGTYTVPSDTDYYTISNIPQTADDLYILANFGGDTSQNGDGRIGVYPNGDGGNMWFIYRGANGGNVSSFMTANYLPLPLGSLNYGSSLNEMTIYNYSSTSLTKSIWFDVSMVNHRNRFGSANYLSTNAITSLGFQVRDYGTVIKANSVISLYTIKRA